MRSFVPGRGIKQHSTHHCSRQWAHIFMFRNTCVSVLHLLAAMHGPKAVRHHGIRQIQGSWFINLINNVAGKL